MNSSRLKRRVKGERSVRTITIAIFFTMFLSSGYKARVNPERNVKCSKLLGLVATVSLTLSMSEAETDCSPKRTAAFRARSFSASHPLPSKAECESGLSLFPGVLGVSPFPFDGGEIASSFVVSGG